MESEVKSILASVAIIAAAALGILVLVAAATCKPIERPAANVVYAVKLMLK